MVSWGYQLGFRAEKKPSHKSNTGVSLKFREVLQITFLGERGREFGGGGGGRHQGSQTTKAMKNLSGRGRRLSRCSCEVIAIYMETEKSLQDETSHPPGKGALGRD